MSRLMKRIALHVLAGLLVLPLLAPATADAPATILVADLSYDLLPLGTDGTVAHYAVTLTVAGAPVVDATIRVIQAGNGAKAGASMTAPAGAPAWR